MGLQFFRSKVGKISLLGFAGTLLCVSLAFAQAPAGGGEAGLDPNLVIKKVFTGFAHEFAIKLPFGGWVFVWMTVVGFAFGLGIALERYYTIAVRGRGKVNMKKFTDQLVKYVEAKDYDHALALCNAAPAAILPVITKAGLDAARRNMGTRAVQDAIDEQTLRIMPVITKRISWVNTLANVSTLFGLMGTIWGLMMTFAGMGFVTNPKMKEDVLTSGISTAMSCTLLGLVSAITLLLIFQYLSQASRSLIDDIDENSVRLINSLSRG